MSKFDIDIEAYVANEPEIRQAGNHRVVDLSLPHTPRKFDKQKNEWVDAGDTVWAQATFWDEHADMVMQTVTKGTLVRVTGAAELEVYEKRDGTPGGKIRVAFPSLAVVVRRPKPGTTAPVAADDSWGAPAAAPSGPIEAAGWASDSTPF